MKTLLLLRCHGCEWNQIQKSQLYNFIIQYYNRLVVNDANQIAVVGLHRLEDQNNPILQSSSKIWGEYTLEL